MLKFVHHFKSPKGQFQISPMARGDVEESADLAAGAYHTSNPLCVHIGARRKDLFTYAKVGFERAANTNMGIVCLDRSTGKIVGTAMAFDMFYLAHNPFPYPDLHEVNSIDEFVSSKAPTFHLTRELELLSISRLAVSQDFQGNGILGELLKFMVGKHPVLKDANFFAECVSPYPSMAMNKLGFDTIGSSDVRNFLAKDGRYIFKDIDITLKAMGIPEYWRGIQFCLKAVKRDIPITYALKQ